MKKILSFLWWLLLLLVPLIALYLIAKISLENSFYFSLFLLTIYFIQGVYYLIRYLQFLFSKNYRKANWTLVALAGYRCIVLYNVLDLGISLDGYKY